MSFKCSARRFVKLHNFLGAILPYSNAEWERLFIFLTLLLPKLPAVKDDEFPSGLYDTVDLESYRIEAKETMSLALDDEDGEILPATVKASPKASEKDFLSVIVYEFNRMFSKEGWKDRDNVCCQINRIVEMIAEDGRCRNALRNSDEQGARIEIEEALRRAVNVVAADSIELYGRYQSNDDFRKWLIEKMVEAVIMSKRNEQSRREYFTE